MPCLLGCLALVAPRFVILLVAIFSQYLSSAYQTWVWPVLGFFFMPLTTLAYAWAWHMGNGNVQGMGIMVIVLAVLMDLGLLGGGGRSTKTVVYGRRNVRVRRG